MIVDVLLFVVFVALVAIFYGLACHKIAAGYGSLALIVAIKVLFDVVQG